jgi:SAM-dependent methyltransferase
MRTRNVRYELNFGGIDSSMGETVQPLKAEKFLKAAMEYLAPWRGMHIYDAKVKDYLEKTEMTEAGYGRWLRDAFDYLSDRYKLAGNRVLDFGCGTGELTVRMRTLGYEAYGFDRHEGHMRLARILAQENNIPDEAFILSRPEAGAGGELPFEDNSFDIVTLFSVLEHLSDSTLRRLLPDLHRVSRGVIYVLVPNRVRTVDDHTGLELVSLMPRRLALAYLRLRGREHQYGISEDGTWDVYYRSFGAIISVFRRAGFHAELVPDGLIYPPLDMVSPPKRIGKHLRLAGKTFLVGVPTRMLVRRKHPEHASFPYLNMVFVPQKADFRS